MDTLLLKLVTIPVLIATASLAGRRWGTAISGWLVGLPFTSAPILFFIALDQGLSFATATSVSVLAGGVSGIAFALTYGWFATNRRQGWLICLSAGYLSFLVITAILQFVFLPSFVVFLGFISILILSIRIFPKSQPDNSTFHYPKWDLPARMITATMFVIVVTGAAPLLGPRLSGLVTPFPIFTSIMAVFSQKTSGIPSAVNLLRGLLYGLFAFATFSLTVSIFLETLGLLVTFLLAISASLTVQGITLILLRKWSARSVYQKDISTWK